MPVAALNLGAAAIATDRWHFAPCAATLLVAGPDGARSVRVQRCFALRAHTRSGVVSSGLHKPIVARGVVTMRNAAQIRVGVIAPQQLTKRVCV